MTFRHARDPRRRRGLLARLEKLRQAHERRRSLLAMFIEHAPAGIAMFDREMRYVAASRRWREDYDLPADVAGQSHYALFPEIGERWKAVHRRALAGEVLSAEEDRFERADGSVQWVTWEARPWYLVSGEIGGIVIAGEEVTERVEARQRLVEAQQEAVAANRAKDDFLAMLGHELRNPLAPVVTALELMRRRGAGCERERAVIERQVRHLAALVDDLLDLSRITRGTIQLSRERVDLADVLARAVEIAGAPIEAGRQRLTVDIPRGLAVDVDPMRLAQVVSNLLANAAKHTPAGGHIALSARREGESVLLAVADQGPGIPPDLLESIFEPFVQGAQSSARSRGGLGLGLTIARRLVEMHGGTIRASSAMGRGSTFTVTLPATSPAAGEARAHDAVAAAMEAPCSHPLRVLVVDDNQDAADLLASFLESLGHATRVAYDPAIALEVATSFRPQVALLDIGLPVMDGYELAGRLRADASPPPLLVAITGYGDANDRRRSAEAGFGAHLVKPITPDQITAVLEKWDTARGQS